MDALPSGGDEWGGYGVPAPTDILGGLGGMSGMPSITGGEASSRSSASNTGYATISRGGSHYDAPFYFKSNDAVAGVTSEIGKIAFMGLFAFGLWVMFNRKKRK